MNKIYDFGADFYSSRQNVSSDAVFTCNCPLLEEVGSVCPSVPIFFKKDAIFQDKESSNKMDSNVIMNDDEVVASDVPRWYLLLYIIYF